MFKLTTSLLLTLLIGCSTAFGEARLTVTVDTGGVARDYAVVEVLIPVDAAISAEYRKRIAGNVRAAGNVGPIQLDPAEGNPAHPSKIKLRWVETDLKADEKRTRAITIARTPVGKETPGFRFVDDADGGRICKLGPRDVWQHWTPTYNPADHVNTYKHFHHVFGFHGEGHITKGAGGRYTHHRGLYIGWSRTTGPNGKYDFWHCKDNVSIRHQGYDAKAEFVGPVASRSVSTAHWLDKEAKPVVIETRTVTTWNVGEGRTLMDFHFKLTSAGGDIDLNGDPQHAGFQFRPRDSVNQTKAKYVRPASTKGKGGDVWESNPWCVNQFTIEDKPYAVMHMDHPKNPGTHDGRTVYSTRNYGRFGAYAPHKLSADKPLEFSYRILVLDPTKHSDASVEQFDALYQSWVKPVKVSVK